MAGVETRRVSAQPQQGFSFVSILTLVLTLSVVLIGWYTMGEWGIVVGIVGGLASCLVPLYLFALATSSLRTRAKGSAIDESLPMRYDQG